MEKPNITPGPWTTKEWEVKKPVFLEFETVSFFEIRESKDNGLLLAGINWIDSNNRTKANAKAISAVPEMIDALVELLRITSYDPNDNRYTAEEYNEIIDNANMALLKAGCKL